MEHTHHSTDNSREYLKFFFVMIGICVMSYAHAVWRGIDLMQFLESFMGVFFIVFACFKLVSLKTFAYGFQSYEVMKHHSVFWGYVFPFVQLVFGLCYVLSFSSRTLDGVVGVWSLVNASIVWLTIRSKNDVHCVCLGNIIKLPLSTISFIEDFGMGVMVFVMLVLR